MPAFNLFGEVPKRGPNNFSEFESGLSDVVTPQLLLIEGQFFTDGTGKWPKISFPPFIKFPIVAGYILGIIDGHLQFKKLRLSDADILLSVMNLDNKFRRSGLDVDLSEHFGMQQSAFKFGLDIGVVDVGGRLAATGRWEYILLGLICQMFLKYDDVKTLKMNLGIFCDMHGIPPREDSTLDEIIKRWDVHKQYDMKWGSLEHISPRDSYERDWSEALRWIHRWAQQGDGLCQNYLGKKYEKGEWFPKDYIEALKWHILAESNSKAEHTDFHARDRDRLSHEMTDVQIAEAQRRARDWKPDT